jgi:hypothetical protein
MKLRGFGHEGLAHAGSWRVQMNIGPKRISHAIPSRAIHPVAVTPESKCAVPYPATRIMELVSGGHSQPRKGFDRPYMNAPGPAAFA